MIDAVVRRIRFIVVLAALLVIGLASTLSAQTTVRVTSDRVTVWNRSFTTVATTVNAGAVLEVVGRQGTWYEVVVPGPSWQPRTTGFIAVSRVEVVSGVPPTAPPSSPGQERDPAAPRQRPRAAQAVRGAATGAARAPWRLFVEGGYGRFTARDSFDAVLGTPGGPWFGGGLLYTMRSGLFVQGGVEHFRATGERVFVVNDVVYSLGIPDRISVTPIMAGGGYRIRPGRVGVYLGGGAGAYLLRETSDFADAADNVKQSNAAYRAFAGVEWPLTRSAAAAFEVQYTTVPDALTGGAAAAFDEHDLGGIQIKAKLLFGK